MRHFRYWGCAAIVASLWTTQVQAQSTVYLPDIVELSGPGAVSGTNWRDGVVLAIDEINKAGGILGRKIEHFVVHDLRRTVRTHLARLMQKTGSSRQADLVRTAMQLMSPLRPAKS